MEPNFIDPNEPNFTQDNDKTTKKSDRERGDSPHNEREMPDFPESNENPSHHPGNFFVLENQLKKTIDDGVTLIVEYIMQEKICPNIMPYQEKLMAYLKEKIESQVSVFLVNKKNDFLRTLTFKVYPKISILMRKKRNLSWI